MTNTITEITGYVTLRGHRIEIGSEIGHRFATDAVRFVEGIATEEQLRKKYQLDDANWISLSENEPLQLLVGRLMEERVRNGTAQREKASLRWNSAIDVIDSIVQDPTAPSRARLDGARELRACASGEPENKPDAREKYIININFGSNKVHKEIELTPHPPEPNDLTIEPERDDDEYRPTGLLRYS
jgi:hypothetical protein